MPVSATHAPQSETTFAAALGLSQAAATESDHGSGFPVARPGAACRQQTAIVPALAGVPETLLWTLYGRAGEARRPGGILRDPEAVRILDSIDYDFAGRFGHPEPLFALRAALIDDALRAWLLTHPDGVIVSLGEGLETQSFRVDNGRMRWISLDMPEAMRLREIFMQPGGRFTHVSASATDPEWIDLLDPAQPTMIVAQGLFMYLEASAVQGILLDISHRLPGSQLIFDTVNKQFAEATLRGHQQTDLYRLPRMNWGVDRNRLVATLRAWRVDYASLRFLPYRPLTRFPEIAESLLDRMIPARGRLNSLVQIRFRSGAL